MSTSDQNAKIRNSTNEKEQRKVTSLTIIPEQKEKDDQANMVATSKTKQRENIRYY